MRGGTIRICDLERFEEVKAYVNERQAVLGLGPCKSDSRVLDLAFELVLSYFKSDLWTKDKKYIRGLQKEIERRAALSVDIRARLAYSQFQEELRAEFEALPASEQRRRRKLSGVGA